MATPALSHFHGPLRVCAANPRYFADDRGQAIYLTGSAHLGQRARAVRARRRAL